MRPSIPCDEDVGGTAAFTTTIQRYMSLDWNLDTEYLRRTWMPLQSAFRSAAEPAASHDCSYDLLTGFLP